MPYRPSEGEKKFSRLPRREEGEREEGPSMPLQRDIRRPPSSPWGAGFEEERPRFESRPLTVPSSSLVPELYEVLVPEAELRDPHARYMEYFEKMPGSTPRARRGAPERGPRREERREEWRPEPAGRPAPAPGPAPRARTRTGPPSLDPGNWFDMNAVWTGIRQRKADPRFQRGTPVGVVQIARASADEMSRAQDLLRFFRVPKAEADKFPGKAIWDKLHEFMDEISYAMNQMRPSDIPGEVGFQAGRDGSFWLGYME